MNNFDNVIYISCNPESMARDLDGLCTSSSSSSEVKEEREQRRPFKIKRFTVLDHFAYSVGHIESAIHLQRS